MRYFAFVVECNKPKKNFFAIKVCADTKFQALKRVKVAYEDILTIHDVGSCADDGKCGLALYEKAIKKSEKMLTDNIPQEPPSTL